MHGESQRAFAPALLAQPPLGGGAGVWTGRAAAARRRQPRAAARARSFQGPGQWKRADVSFQHLAVGSYGHLFPIVIGETGSLLTSARGPRCRSRPYACAPWAFAAALRIMPGLIPTYIAAVAAPRRAALRQARRAPWAPL